MATKWYVIRTVAGKEKKAKEHLEFEFKTKGYGDKIKQVIIPLEKVCMTRNGKKYTTERNYYPGYIVIEADPIIIGEIKHLNKSINNVVGFLGGDNPTALRPDEIERILGKMDELNEADEKFLERYFIGEIVKVVDGQFSNFIGTINEVNDERRKVKLDVKIFGRLTPLELDYSQIHREE
jgi:transcriptional antiterminator NusG